MKIRTKLMIVCLGMIILTTLAVSIFAVWQNKKAIVSSVQAKAKSDLATTWNLVNLQIPGEWRVENNKLYKGQTLLNGNFAVVDGIIKLTEGSSTIFLQDTRIATTVKKPDGSRAVGTKAAPEVIQTVLKEGKEFYGEAIVVDKKIQTGYRPIKDSQGKIIGMWYVGVSKDFIDSLVLNTIMGIAGVSFVVIIIGVFVAIMVARYFEVPVLAIMKSMKQAEEGSLNVAVDISSNDEIGVLAKSFTNMMSKFQTLIGDVQGVVGRVKDTGGLLMEVSKNSVASCRQVSDTMKQLASTNQEENSSARETSLITEQLEQVIEQISKGAQEQAANVNATSELVIGMAKSIEEVASNSQDVTEAVLNTERVAEEGRKSVVKTIEGMQRIKATVYQSAEQIKELGKHSQQIGEIVEMIDEIAEQTNLLALNAAIEAARAGEQGKGFAVVADEVRKLAERSGKATKEITTLINTIRQLTGQAVNGMEQGTSEVETGSTLADEAGEALNQIIHTVKTVNEQVKSITKTTQEISASSAKVVEATNNIAAITQENSAATQEMAASSSQVTKSVSQIAGNIEGTAAMSEEVSASMQEMTNLAEEISVSARNLDDIVRKLENTVGVFKI